MHYVMQSDGSQVFLNGRRPAGSGWPNMMFAHPYNSSAY